MGVCAPRPGDAVFVGRSGRRYSGRAGGLLSLDHPVRQRFIALVEWPWFDRVVLLLILLNCVGMAMRDPIAVAPAAWELPAEWVFTVAFTLEGLARWWLWDCAVRLAVHTCGTRGTSSTSWRWPPRGSR
jgi:hypothetical protein